MDEFCKLLAWTQCVSTFTVISNIYFFLNTFYSLEVVLRAETVEQAQAGDKCDFIGTLIVVPDVSKLQFPGRMFYYHLNPSQLIFGLLFSQSRYFVLL